MQNIPNKQSSSQNRGLKFRLGVTSRQSLEIRRKNESDCTTSKFTTLYLKAEILF